MNCRKKSHNHSLGMIMGAGVAIALGIMIAANIKDIVRYIKISSM